MKNNKIKILAYTLVAAFIVSGCATARPRKPDAADTQTQVASLQSELQAKDQQIQDLQYQLQSNQAVD